MKDERKILHEKAKYYLEKDKAIHVVTFNDWFYNGKIIDLSEDRIILLDIKVGETFLLFDEIKGIEPYEEKEVEK
jgi:hypothetical protein